jgi:hypothetical protein
MADLNALIKNMEYQTVASCMPATQPTPQTITVLLLAHNRSTQKALSTIDSSRSQQRVEEDEQHAANESDQNMA